MVDRSMMQPVVSGELRVTQARSRSDLDRYRDAWSELAAGNPMRSPEWLLTWWDSYSTPDDELRVLLLHDRQGALVGLAPLYSHADGRRTLCLLGSGAVATNHATWLAAPEMESQVGTAVAQALVEWQEQWDCIHFDWIDSDDPAVNATLEALSEQRLLVHRAPHQHHCWRIALPQTWDAFLGMLSKSHRKRCRKWQRLFLDTERVRFHGVTNAAELDQGFDVLLRLHAKRWGDRKHPLGCFSDDRFLEYHRAVTRQLLDRNQLVLFWLELDGTPIAAEYQFLDRTSIHSYLAGMDPEVTEFPPGNLAIMVAIKYAIAQGLSSFDFSRGNQPYKANFRATPTRCDEVRIWPDRLSARIEAARWLTGKGIERKRLQAAHWIKSHLSEELVSGLRRATYLFTGNRFGPRKRSDSDLDA